MKECCEKCLNSEHALKGKFKDEFGGICGLVCECHKSMHPNVKSMQNWEKSFDEKFGVFITNNDYHSNVLKSFIHKTHTDLLSELVRRIEDNIVPADPVYFKKGLEAAIEIIKEMENEYNGILGAKI